MSGKVFVLGSFNVDIVANVPRFPKAGESILATKSLIGPGGKGANQALSASKAGADVHFLTKVGNDHFYSLAENHLVNSPISKVTLCKDENEATGNAIIYVSESNAENMIAIYSGANATITDIEIESVKTELAASSLFLTQLENNISAIGYGLKLAKSLGVKTVLNPAPYSDAILPYLSEIDIITPNETEASLLSGIEVNSLETAKQAAKIIHQKGVGTIIITLGSKGSLLFDGEHYEEVASFPAQVVDTTGAGDSFNGAFCAHLARGQSLIESAQFASAFASLAVEREGASNVPTYEEAMNRLKQVNQ